MISCYLGLGGNLQNPLATVEMAIELIALLPEVFNFKVSKAYLTTPVSHIPQDLFINAACGFTTTLSIEALFKEITSIENKLGKTPKNKDAPRTIDIDILYYGTYYHSQGPLIIPHPRLFERLFVLKPLSDIILSLPLPHPITQTTDLQQVLEIFSNPNQEKVFSLGEFAFKNYCKGVAYAI